MRNVLGVILLGASLLAGSTPVQRAEPEPCVCQCQCVIDTCGGGGTVVSGGGDSSSTINRTFITKTIIEDSGEIVISNNKVNYHPHINNVGNDKVSVHINNNNNTNGGGKKGKK
jgi:hypothetical protein